MRRLLLLALLAAGCGRAAPDWSVTVAERNAAADRLIDEGDGAGARAVLETILRTAPGEGAGGTRRVLLQDTYFRLARLALDAHDPALAARQAEAGLALGGEEDLFLANLLVVRGAAHEAAGETAQALAVYQRALRINEALLHHTLGPP
jgi:tetratricopeptide (TPR) repeat protein